MNDNIILDAECAKFVLDAVKEYHEKGKARGWATTGISFDADILTHAVAHFQRMQSRLDAFEGAMRRPYPDEKELAQHERDLNDDIAEAQQREEWEE